MVQRGQFESNGTGKEGKGLKKGGDDVVSLRVGLKWPARLRLIIVLCG